MRIGIGHDVPLNLKGVEGMKRSQQINRSNIGFHERIRQDLSIFTERNIGADGSVVSHSVSNSYFLENDVWNIHELTKISNFSGYSSPTYYRTNLRFEINSPSVNLEVKYVWFQKLFRDEWSLSTIYGIGANKLSKLTAFLNEKYSTLHSLLDLEMAKAEREWISWLSERGVKTMKRGSYFHGDYLCQTPIAAFLRLVQSNLLRLTDSRIEWEKDRWDVRVLHSNFGINYNKSASAYQLNFSGIEPFYMRELVKKYVKRWLLDRYSWPSAIDFVKHIALFINHIFSEEKTWKNFNHLKRVHIERYIDWLKQYVIKNKKITNHERYLSSNLSHVGKFLDAIYRYDNPDGPEIHVSLLIFQEDKPRQRKKSIDQINYIPDTVLEQLFTHIHHLDEEAQPVIWVAFKTGMRISEVLGLNQSCLIKLNGKYYIETDIEKTFVIGHRIPIDDELANILSIHINLSKSLSNEYNNPEKYIFVRYRGARKGKPYSQEWIRVKLKKLAKEKNIRDENGDLFHFKTHQFRHTYAVKMLNSGVDIFTVQELLAHASPEMTLLYAKLLDNTKRKAFEEAVKQGVFSFDLNGQVQEVKPEEDIPTDILETLWQDHKLNAIDNPYGTCHARINGNCPYSEEPPCLSCNGGSPCKDLAIGFSDLDTQKYELLIETTIKTISVLENLGRGEVAKKNKKNLERYENILNTIQEGHIIFGRLERVRGKKGVSDG